MTRYADSLNTDLAGDETSPPRGLTPYERQAVRLESELGGDRRAIAAAMGLTVSRVATLLWEARRKDADVPYTECGHVARCSRRSGHSGHHGGFRSIEGGAV